MAFQDATNCCFNTKLWGSPESPEFWKVPTEKDRDGNTVISTLSFGNVRTRKAMDNLEHLIEICILQDLHQRWKECISNYRSAMKIVRSHDDLDDGDIIQFQRHVDEFYQDWIVLGLGKKGITNYMHLLGSGHVSELLFKWRNLYVHSQKWWEALNSLIKSVYFRRTNRGGGKGLKSKLYSVARWCQRKMLWASGYTFKHMEQEVQRNGWTVSDKFKNHTDGLPEEDLYDLSLIHI